MSKNKATKIIATIGPASNHENILLSMVKKGVNAFRLNFSHGDLSQHFHSIEIIREIEKKLNVLFKLRSLTFLCFRIRLVLGVQRSSEHEIYFKVKIILKISAHTRHHRGFAIYLLKSQD